MTKLTKTLLAACVATLFLANNAMAASPDSMIAQATSNNINEIVQAKTFAVVEFEVEAEEQTITPFGEDLEVNEKVAAVMAAPGGLADCIDDCIANSTSEKDRQNCIGACFILFPSGIAIGY